MFSEVGARIIGTVSPFSRALYFGSDLKEPNVEVEAEIFRFDFSGHSVRRTEWTIHSVLPIAMEDSEDDKSFAHWTTTRFHTH